MNFFGRKRPIPQEVAQLEYIYNQFVDNSAYRPYEGMVRDGEIYRHGRWVSMRDLQILEREEKWRSYSTDELHDMADSILDEISARQDKWERKTE